MGSDFCARSDCQTARQGRYILSRPWADCPDSPTSCNLQTTIALLQTYRSLSTFLAEVNYIGIDVLTGRSVFEWGGALG